MHISSSIEARRRRLAPQVTAESNALTLGERIINNLPKMLAFQAGNSPALVSNTNGPKL